MDDKSILQTLVTDSKNSLMFVFLGGLVDNKNPPLVNIRPLQVNSILGNKTLREFNEDQLRLQGGNLDFYRKIQKNWIDINQKVQTGILMLEQATSRLLFLVFFYIYLPITHPFF